MQGDLFFRIFCHVILVLTDIVSPILRDTNGIPSQKQVADTKYFATLAGSHRPISTTGPKMHGLPVLGGVQKSPLAGPLPIFCHLARNTPCPQLGGQSPFHGSPKPLSYRAI